jgi:hypothetical protein
MLAEKVYWRWIFQAATGDLTSWKDVHGDYWVVDPNSRCIWEWGTIWSFLPDGSPLGPEPYTLRTAAQLESQESKFLRSSRLPQAGQFSTCSS